MSVAAPAELESGAASPEAVLRWAYESFPRVAIVASFQAESSVLIDMAVRIRPDVRVLTLDTGRLPQETYDMIDRVRDRYAIEIEVISPDARDLAEMVGSHGVNLFHKSPDLSCAAMSGSRGPSRGRCIATTRGSPVSAASRRRRARILSS